MRQTREYRCIYATLCIMIGIIYWVAMHYFTYTGDDLGYLMAIKNRVADKGTLLAYPAYVYSHWLTTNGRLSNLIMPLFLWENLKALTDLIMAVSMSLMLWLTIYASRLGKGRLTLVGLLLALMVFTLPWWDSMLLYCCWFSYVISAALSIGATLVILYANPDGFWKKSGAIVLAFLGGGSHEACGVALAAGLLVYMAINRKTVIRFQWVLMGFLILGSLVPLSCPAAWGRLEAAAGTDYSMWSIVSKSAFYVIALVLWILVSMLFKPGRKVLVDQLHTEWVVWVVAALVSAGFCAVSGIVGRTGFFAQIFALIAFFYQFGRSQLKISYKMAAIINLVVLFGLYAHLIEFVNRQIRCGEELKSAIEQYQKSKDGIVYIDYTTDTELPWWILHKVRGVPDADDLYILKTIHDHYKPDGPEMLVLPEAMKNIDVSKIKGLQKVGKNGYVTAEQPQTRTYMTYEKIPLLLMDANLDGTEVKEYVIQPFNEQGRTLWYITLRDIDPGD